MLANGIQRRRRICEWYDTLDQQYNRANLNIVTVFFAQLLILLKSEGTSLSNRTENNFSKGTKTRDDDHGLLDTNDEGVPLTCFYDSFKDTSKNFDGPNVTNCKRIIPWEHTKQPCARKIECRSHQIL